MGEEVSAEQLLHDVRNEEFRSLHDLRSLNEEAGSTFPKQRRYYGNEDASYEQRLIARRDYLSCLVSGLNHQR